MFLLCKEKLAQRSIIKGEYYILIFRIGIPKYDYENMAISDDTAMKQKEQR